ncbi:GumC family protein [Donghicola mangrovi]|uniref:non-specific protein-tyrosine kinase n=1 Tax=Donghicola mangrovi TaxID=2729614 RepID=A0A850Q1P8_9RHOB|nr:polysaccharide biosynthesis tyrosine autokinase [Donghicola mangrovi]NVO23006.1 polysaccharide biosynthesis tyrosine autokinase [Donghicola mangrovi]
MNRDQLFSEVDLTETIEKFESIFFRNWKIIIFLPLFTLAISISYLIFVTPRYTASASILIDPRNGLNPYQANEISPGLLTSDGLTVESEIRIIGSREVTSRAAHKLGLDKFTNEESKTTNFSLSAIREWLRGTGYFEILMNDDVSISNENTQERKLEAVRSKFSKGLEVRRSGDAYIVEVLYTSNDIEFAPLAVNTVISEYLTISREQHVYNVEKNQQWLKSRISELGAEVDTTEREIAEFRQKYQLLSPEGTLLPTEIALNAAIEEKIQLTSRALSLDVQATQLKEQIETGDVNAITIDVSDRSKALDEFERIYIDLLQQEQSLLLSRNSSTASALNLKSRIQEQRALIISEYIQVQQRLTTRGNAIRNQIAGLDALMANLRQEHAAESTEILKLRSLERDANAKRALYEKLLEQYNDTTQLLSFDATSARVIAQAVIPDSKSFPNNRMILMIGLLSGILVAFAITSVLETWNDSLYDRKIASRKFNLNFLGVVPSLKSKFLLRELTNIIASGYIFTDQKIKIRENWILTMQTMRAVHVNLIMKRENKNDCGSILGVTSTRKGEGKTTTSMILAKYLANQNHKTVFIDLDFFERGATKLLAQDLRPDQQLENILESYLNNERCLDEIYGKSKIWFIGNSKPDLIMTSAYIDRLAELMRYLQKNFDFIIIDLPPVAGNSETKFLTSLCEEILYVIKWGDTRSSDIDMALEQINFSENNNVLGFIFSKVNMKLFNRINKDDFYYKQ